MQFSTATSLALLGFSTVVAFDPTKDSCVPEAHAFKGSFSPGFVACTLTSSTTHFDMYNCGGHGTVVYDPHINQVIVPLADSGLGRRTLYGSCTTGPNMKGSQVAHISVSTPLSLGGDESMSFPGFNRPCTPHLYHMSFSLYDLTPAQTLECTKHPIKRLD